MRTYVLRWLAVVLAVLTLGIGTYALLKRPRTLVVAVGPGNSAHSNFMRAVARVLADSGEPFRFQIRPTSSLSESSRLLDEGKVDLAVLRSDDSSSREARSVAVLQTRALLVVSRADRKVNSLLSLKDRKIAVVRGGSDSNLPVINLVLGHYGIKAADIGMTEMDLDDAAEALASGSVDAFLVFSYPGSRRLRVVIGELSESRKVKLAFSGTPAAEALAFRYKDLESAKFPAGIFGGSPPKPKEGLESVAVTYELVVSQKRSERLVTKLAGTLLDIRPKLRRGRESSFSITMPDVEDPRRFLPHAGTIAHVNDTAESFLETYSEQLWLGLFAASILGSSITAFFGWIGLRKEPEIKSVRNRLPEVVERIHAARTIDEIDAIDQEVDDIIKAMVIDYANGTIDASEGDDPGRAIPLITQLIERRRAALAMPHAAQ